jgi:hypothetical protein
VKLSDGNTHTIVVWFDNAIVDVVDSNTGASLRSFSEPDSDSVQAPDYDGCGASVVELNASTGAQVWSYATGASVRCGVPATTL